jgi:hypothetical protein
MVNHFLRPSRNRGKAEDQEARQFLLQHSRLTGKPVSLINFARPFLLIFVCCPGELVV